MELLKEVNLILLVSEVTLISQENYLRSRDLDLDYESTL